MDWKCHLIWILFSVLGWCSFIMHKFWHDFYNIKWQEEKEENQGDIPHARFQRTDQWRPVYIWLESLDKDEVVKSKDISDWLTENPDIQEQLCSRHSRYHLMHYIKKCHMKILKRREKKKVLNTSCFSSISLEIFKRLSEDADASSIWTTSVRFFIFLLSQKLFFLVTVA